jgi:hypothetical protein
MAMPNSMVRNRQNVDTVVPVRGRRDGGTNG